MFSGFLIVSVVFTMFIAAVVWLPLLLAVIEWMIRKQEEKGATSYSPIPYVVVGALIVGVMILAGHPELIYYTLLVAGAYSAVRLLAAWRVIGRSKNKDRISDDLANATNRHHSPSPTAIRSSFFVLLRLAIWLLVMVFLGVALGAIQLIPLLELVPMNFREGSASLAQVRDWAWPSRHILTFALPNIFGSPSHHGWFDIWTRQWNPATVNALGEPIDTIFWGIKNYVEGGNYVGVVTWVLAGVAVLRAACCVLREVGWRRGSSVDPPTIHSSPFTHSRIHHSPPSCPHLVLHLPRRPLPALRLRHAALRHPVLRPARLGSASQPLPLGLSVHGEHGGVGGGGVECVVGCGGARGEERGAVRATGLLQMDRARYADRSLIFVLCSSPYSPLRVSSSLLW